MAAFDPVTGAEDLISNIGGDIIKHFFPDPAQQAQAKQRLEALQQNGDLAVLSAQTQLKLAQIGVDNTEAAKPGLFSDWRDFIGWVCGLSFAWQYFLLPIALFAASYAHHPLSALPDIKFNQLDQVLLLLLGGGAGTLKLIDKHLSK